MAQSNIDEIPKETLELAGALANAMKGKNEEELLNLMQNLLTVAKGSSVDEKESNVVSDVKLPGNGAVDPVLSLSSCDTSCDDYNESTPEVPTLPLETNTSDTATGLKPVISSDSEVVLPGVEDVLNGNNDSTNKENTFEVKESEDESKPGHREPSESNSSSFKPEIPRRTDLEEQRKGTESSAEFHHEDENREKDATVPVLSNEPKGSTLKSDNQSSTTTHQFDDDEIVKNSDDDFYSVSENLPLESNDSPAKVELDIFNAQAVALNMDSRSLTFVSDSDGDKQKKLQPDNMPAAIFGVNSSNVTMEKNGLSSSSYGKATSQQLCSLDTTKMKLSAVSDEEDMAASTPPSGEDITESDNSSQLEISENENEGMNHQIDYGSVSPKETEISKPSGSEVEVLDLNEKQEIVSEELGNQETISSFNLVSVNFTVCIF